MLNPELLLEVCRVPALLLMELTTAAGQHSSHTRHSNTPYTHREQTTTGRYRVIQPYTCLYICSST